MMMETPKWYSVAFLVSGTLFLVLYPIFGDVSFYGAIYLGCFSLIATTIEVKYYEGLSPETIALLSGGIIMMVIAVFGIAYVQSLINGR